MTEAKSTAKQFPAKIFIVEDHPIVRHGLRQLIETQPDLKVCGEAERVHDALKLIETLKPDVALVDLTLKDGDGMDLIRQIREHWVGMKIIVVSTSDAAIYGPIAMKAGAMGFVNKHEAIDQIVDAIHCVLGGKIFSSKCGCQKVSHWFG